MNMTPSTDDEVLALAERIRRQRELDSEYLKAFNLLAQLRKDLSPSGNKELRNWVAVKFWTISNDGHQDDWSVNLPTQCSDDLINYLMEYTGALTPD